MMLQVLRSGEAYDGNGNTLTKADSSGTTTYNWDFENPRDRNYL